MVNSELMPCSLLSSLAFWSASSKARCCLTKAIEGLSCTLNSDQLKPSSLTDQTHVVVTASPPTFLLGPDILAGKVQTAGR